MDRENFIDQLAQVELSKLGLATFGVSSFYFLAKLFARIMSRAVDFTTQATIEKILNRFSLILKGQIDEAISPLKAEILELKNKIEKNERE